MLSLRLPLFLSLLGAVPVLSAPSAPPVQDFSLDRLICSLNPKWCQETPVNGDVPGAGGSMRIDWNRLSRLPEELICELLPGLCVPTETTASPTKTLPPTTKWTKKPKRKTTPAPSGLPLSQEDEKEKLELLAKNHIVQEILNPNLFAE